MSDVLHDLRTSLRTLSRRPIYPVAAIAILTLGLSVAVAVFAYINGFNQPFPGADADGLVRVFGTQEDQRFQEISYLDFLDYAAADRTLDGIAATSPYFAASVRLETMTEVAFLEAVSGDYFSVLDVGMAIGRGLATDDDRPAADPVAVISYDWWQRSFGADRSVIGREIFLNFRPFTIVGVAAPEFRGSTSDFRPQVWIPLAPFRDRYTSWDTRARNRDIPLVRVYGRLRSGMSGGQALAELKTIAAGLDDTYPRQRGVRDLRVERATWIDPRARMAEASTIRLMTVAALVLLLLVCANVANLLLSVAIGRRREAAVRAALGASPWRLCRNVFLENVVLSGIAGAAALAAARPLSARIGSYFARPSVWGENVAREAVLDWRVVAFAIAVSLGTGVIAGVLPAIRSWARDLVGTLRSDARQSAGAENRIWGWRAFGVHDLLISTQVTLTIVLLVVAGLVVRTLVTAGDLDPGFAFDRLVVTHISTSSTTLEASDRDRFFRELAQRLGEEAWVQDATVADYAPLSPHPSANLLLPDQTEPAPIVYSMVIPGFFDALDIDVASGRGFAVSDSAGAADVAIVNQALVDQYFAGASAIGRALHWPGRGDEGADRVFEIVGVVRDTKTQDYFSEPEATVYFSYPQHPYPTGSALLVAVSGDASGAVPRLTTWLRDFEPHLAIVNVIPYTEVVRGFLYTQRMNAELFSALALLALGLAVIGIFAVVSLAVGRRTREIGIRIAVGAGRGTISRWVVRRALVPVLVGVGAGLVASLAMTGLVRGLLFGIEPIDPATYASGAVALVIATLAAAYIPARRAAALDPVASLRGD